MITRRSLEQIQVQKARENWPENSKNWQTFREVGDNLNGFRAVLSAESLEKLIEKWQPKMCQAVQILIKNVMIIRGVLAQIGVRNARKNSSESEYVAKNITFLYKNV